MKEQLAFSDNHILRHPRYRQGNVDTGVTAGGTVDVSERDAIRVECYLAVANRAGIRTMRANAEGACGNAVR